MMTPIGLTEFSAWAAGSLVAAAWEGLVLAGVVAVCLRMLPGISAAARSLVWMAVLVVVAGLPFVHLAGGSGGVGAGQVHVDERIGFALAAVWGLMSLVRAGQLVRSAFWLRGIAGRAVPVAVDGSVAVLLNDKYGDSGFARMTDFFGTATFFGRRPVRLCASDEVDRPSVVGFFAPRILVPGALLERLSGDELRQIVLHEMEHLRRGDDWTNLVQKLSLVAFPLNPALIWIERQLCLERELACDDRVLRATGARKAYAACLANLAEHSLVRRGVSLALGAWERQSELVRRVHRILARPQGQMGRGRVGFAVAVLLAGVAVGADGLAHAPELVSFGPARGSELASVAARGAFPQGLKPDFVVSRDGGSRVPALQSAFRSTNVGLVAARPTLVKAVMSERRAMPVAKATQHVARAAEDTVNIPVVDAVERASNMGHPDASPADDEPVVVMVTFRSVERSTGGVIVRDSHFSYAAVPMRDGWLFVQL